MYSLALRSVLPAHRGGLTALGQREDRQSPEEAVPEVQGAAVDAEEEPKEAFEEFSPPWAPKGELNGPTSRAAALAAGAVAEASAMAGQYLAQERAEQAARASRAPLRSGIALEYLVDNSELGAQAPGLTYRFSKSLEDRDDVSELATFGSIILGVDEGDGWLRVGERFLPMFVHGIPVLSREAAAQQREVEAERRRRAAAAERLQRADPVAWNRRQDEAERHVREMEERHREVYEADSRRRERTDFAWRTNRVLNRYEAGEEPESQPQENEEPPLPPEATPPVEEAYDFDFSGDGRPFRRALGKASRVARACGSKENIRLAMEQLRGKVRMRLADRDGQVRHVGHCTPFGGLGECADPDCGAHRLAWPEVRPSFRDFIVAHVQAAARGDARRWWGEEGLRYASLGSGQLLFDLELVERLRLSGVSFSQLCLVDTAYEQPELEERRALREFADWQRAAAQLCRHRTAEILAFSSVQDYRAAAVGSSADPSDEITGRAAGCHLLVHCDGGWPGAFDECDRLAFDVLAPGGLFVRLSNDAGPGFEDLEEQHCVGEFKAEAWRKSWRQPWALEPVDDVLLRHCRRVIALTRTTEPSYDLVLARSLAEARAYAKAEKLARDRLAQRHQAPDKSSKAKSGNVDFVFQFPRPRQPPPEYFEQRKHARTRVPGRGKVLQFVPEVFEETERPESVSESNGVSETGSNHASTGISKEEDCAFWRVVCQPHLVVRSQPKNTAQMVGLLHTGEEVVTNGTSDGHWLKIVAAPAHPELPASAWIPTDPQTLGVEVVLKRLPG